MLSLLTISIIAVSGATLVILGGLYAFRSLRRRSRQSSNLGTSITDGTSQTSGQNEVNVEQEVDSNANEDKIVADDDPESRTEPFVTNNEAKQESPAIEAPASSNKGNNSDRKTQNEVNLVQEVETVPANSTVGDENVDPVVMKSNGTMSSGSFGAESGPVTSPGSQGKRRSTGMVLRSRIPRKIRDLEPDPRDAERYKSQSGPSTPSRLPSANSKNSPSPGVSPAASLPSPVSIKTRDTNQTVSPLTTSSSGFERSAFDTKNQVKD